MEIFQMTRILVITQRSFLFIFLISANSYALSEPKYLPSAKEQKQNLFYELSTYLNNKGLEENVAQQKVHKLLESSPQLSQKVQQLSKLGSINLTKEMLFEKLSEYALFEKKCDLNSYSGLVGFVQKIDPTLTSGAKQSLEALAEA